MAASTLDLCTLADVRAYRQKPTGDTGQDTIIQTLITAASRAINTYVGVDFTPTNAGTAPTSHVFVYRGGGRLSLTDGRKVAQSVTSIQVDTDTASPTTLDSTEWALRPKPARDGVYRSIRLPGLGTQTYGPDYPGGRDQLEREITVTGIFGWPSVPEDVRHWAVITVCSWLDNNVQAFSRTFVIDEGRLERPESLPSAVRAGLRTYRQTPAP